MKRLIFSFLAILILHACVDDNNSSDSAAQNQAQEKTPDPISSHIAHLNTTNFGDRPIGVLYAQESLLKEGERAIPAMLEAVESTYGSINEPLKMVLFNLPRTEATNQVWVKMKKIREKRVKENSKYTDNKNWPAIPGMIHDRTIYWETRSEAAKALMDQDQLSPIDLVPLLNSDYLVDKKVAVTAINNQAFMDKGRRDMAQKFGSAKMRSSQIEKISESDQQILSSLLVKNLNSSDEAVIRRAALALGAFGNGNVVPELLKALPESPPYGQEGIIMALSDLGDTNAVPSLNSVVVSAKTPYARAAAAMALEAFVDESSKDPLIQATGDQAWLVRYHSARALAKFKDPGTGTVFNKLQFDENATVQAFAKNTVGQFGNPMAAIKVKKSRTKPYEAYLPYLIGNDAELAGALEIIESGKRMRFKDRAEQLLRVIARLEERRSNIASSEGDRLLFLSGLTKSELAVIMWFVVNDKESSTVKAYYNKHQAEYKKGSMGEGQYLSADFREITEKFPASPLAEEAAYAMAINRTKGFHCERGIDCMIYRELNAFVPFLKEYPQSPKVSNLIDSINRTSFEDLITRPGQVSDLGRSAPYMQDYFEAVNKFPNRADRAKALYPIARAFIVMNEREKANEIYMDLLSNYADLFDRDKLEADYERLKAGMKG